MVTLYNNYIFLPKERNTVVSEQIDDIRCFKIDRKLPFYIKSIFGEPISKDTDHILSKTVSIYEIEVENVKYEPIFTIHNITQYFYLDICVSGKTKKQVIKVLEFIQEKIVDSDIKKQYVMIISYDAISEYYCNKVYPKLNQLERNLRKLLFNVYTVRFGVDYYQKTISPDLQNKIKSVIQAKGNEEKKQIERLKKFFYSMEFSDVQNLLFTKRWTEIEEDNKSEFLSEHEKLTELSEEELRMAFDMFSPKSDWERFFADKLDNYEIEKMIETVRSMRNDIAHCKFFGKEQYVVFNKTVSSLNCSIIKAIKLTEEQDFLDKQSEFVRTALLSITDSIAQLQNQMKQTIIDTAISIAKSISTSMQE